jgi:hypothetical protein
MESYRSGEMSAGIMLTNSATETGWWQMAGDACDALCSAGVAFDSSRW